MTPASPAAVATPAAPVRASEAASVRAPEAGPVRAAAPDGRPLRVRWLGRVPYRDAWSLQRALHVRSHDDHLLLLEHPHVYTLGTSSHPEHVLVDPGSVGAELVPVDRGGDVTYHGPGQLVGYPVLTLPEWRHGRADVVAYVRALEDVLVAALADLGVDAGTVAGYTGVWIGPGAAPETGAAETTGTAEKVAAIGVKVRGRRSMHGFALNVDPDLAMFGHIVPCGIADRGVTSLARVLGRPVAMRDVVDAVVDRFGRRFGPADRLERQDVVWRHHPDDLSAFSREAAGYPTGADPRRSPGSDAGRPPGSDAGRPPGSGAGRPPGSGAGRPPGAGDPASRLPAGVPVRVLGRLAEAGVVPPGPGPRPPWMRVRVPPGDGVARLSGLMRDLDLRTVCEEAGCPNLPECWSDGTATFMILGDRCTRACGFCLVDTRRPLALDPDEPSRVAEAVARMGLDFAVVTSVARDDLDDGGASGFAATIAAIRSRTPDVGIEVLIPDCRGDERALATIFDARPDVLNHNLETVARLQRAARPSAGYARSLAVLARSVEAGLVTKSGLVLGFGETFDEIRGAMADLRAVGVEILTLGQYLRPTPRHLPVVRWWHPDDFAALAEHGRALGFAHVEAGPLVRSSYHAKRGAAGARAVGAERDPSAGAQGR